MRALIFTKRNIKEILRDPLSYVFCVGMPVVLLVLFQIINNATGGGTPWFEPGLMTPGIRVFSYAFVMLYMALLVSKDRTTAFLTRLYTSPMTAADFNLGYIIPGVIIALLQAVLSTATGAIISAITSASVNYFYMFASILVDLPVIIFDIALGVLFGCLFSDKAAPGVTSFFISAGGVLGGAWMPIDQMGGFETFCRFLPFYPATQLSKAVSIGLEINFDNIWVNLLSVVAYMTVALILAVLVFSQKMRSDSK